MTKPPSFESRTAEQEFLDAIANGLPSILCSLWKHGIVSPNAPNEAYTKLTGIPDVAVQDMPFWDAFFFPEEREEAKNRYERFEAGEDVGEIDSFWLTATGKPLEVAWSLSRLPDYEGFEVCMLTGIDVTERRRAERQVKQALKEQEALRRVATLVASDPTFAEVLRAVTSEVGQVFDAATAQLWRFQGDEAVLAGGWDPRDTAAPARGSSDVPEAKTLVDRVRATGTAARLDFHEPNLPDGAAAPISVEGTPWGAISITTRGTDRFPEGIKQRLEGFAELVAQAIANAQAREELRASRARIVEAGDSERKRLERNLHDGAQQRLVSLSLALRLARTQLTSDPNAASATLDAAADELGLALEELRELAQGLHPAVLTNRGLGQALEGVAARLPMRVELHVRLDDRLPEQVEAALYYAVVEALTNVAKHASAGVAMVRITVDDGRALAEILDDGVGGADATAGSGLRGLSDRVAALDGHLTVESESGSGTLVRVEVPLARRPA